MPHFMMYRAMLRRTINYTFTVLLCSSLFIHVTVGYAEDQSERGDQPQTGSSQQYDQSIVNKNLFDQLRNLKSELIQLDKAYASEENELERTMLRSELNAKREVLITGLEKLISQTEKLEADGQDSTQFRTDGLALLNSLTNSLEKSILKGQQRISDLRRLRTSASPEELPPLDKEIAERHTALDEDLTIFFEITRMLEAQGGDAGTQYKFLDATVEKRAKALSGILTFLTEEVASMGRLAPGLSEGEKQAQAAKLAAYNGGIQRIASHLNATVAIMKERGIETAPYTRLLIESTGELTEDIFQTEVAMGLLRGWIESLKEWILENGPRWATRIVVFILILLAFKVLSGIVKRLVRKAAATSKLNLSQLLRDQIVFFSGKAFMFVGLLVALSQLGIQLGPVLAGLGIAGFIVGFALQDTLANFASGMMILLYRPFDVGDSVEAGGVLGKVKAMNLVSTTITTFDNQKLVVPNSKIWGDVIRNITAEPNRRVDMTFGISYSDNIDQAEQVLKDIVSNHELVLAEPAPDIKLHNLGDSSVDFLVRPWARTQDYWTVYWDITHAVKKRFDEEGISIPFPQRDVHLIQEKATT